MVLLSPLIRGCRTSFTKRWQSSSHILSGSIGGRPLPPDFTFYPSFFGVDEQCVLLKAALRKLDSMESTRFRRRRKEYLRASGASSAGGPVQALFLPDELYDFQEGHFDGVIRHYREMHVSSWPDDMPDLHPLLEKLHRILPDQDIQTHILHLASNGEILPHVDNLEASGSWILGVSLGDQRTLRLENPTAPTERFEIPLPSGSVYLQRDSLRYNYQHSILEKPDGRQRLSIMIRDRKA
ncbi:hypothetical protein C8Q73DRAFT_678408 [Cubamyces lactineus]|nr:hypothetical protein C8Q73DRAFT_678408 [Cubamyces lactineus]